MDFLHACFLFKQNTVLHDLRYKLQQKTKCLIWRGEEMCCNGESWFCGNVVASLRHERMNYDLWWAPACYGDTVFLRITFKGTQIGGSEDVWYSSDDENCTARPAQRHPAAVQLLCMLGNLDVLGPICRWNFMHIWWIMMVEISILISLFWWIGNHNKKKCNPSVAGTAFGKLISVKQFAPLQ